MRQRNNFLEQIRRKAPQATKTKPETGAPKPAGEMTEAELDAEIRRLKGVIRESKEETVRIGREEDLLTVRAFRRAHGDPPPAGFPGFRRLWWRLSQRGGGLS